MHLLSGIIYIHAVFISIINSRATLQTKKVRRIFSDYFYSTFSLYIYIYIYIRTFIHYHLLFITVSLIKT